MNTKELMQATEHLQAAIKSLESVAYTQTTTGLQASDMHAPISPVMLRLQYVQRMINQVADTCAVCESVNSGGQNDA